MYYASSDGMLVLSQLAFNDVALIVHLALIKGVALWVLQQDPGAGADGDGADGRHADHWWLRVRVLPSVFAHSVPARAPQTVVLC